MIGAGQGGQLRIILLINVIINFFIITTNFFYPSRELIPEANL